MMTSKNERFESAIQRYPSLICEDCGTQFHPDEAPMISILGPGYARYSCPNQDCSWIVRSVPPEPNVQYKNRLENMLEHPDEYLDRLDLKSPTKRNRIKEKVDNIELADYQKEDANERL